MMMVVEDGGIDGRRLMKRRWAGEERAWEKEEDEGDQKGFTMTARGGLSKLSQWQDGGGAE